MISVASPAMVRLVAIALPLALVLGALTAPETTLLVLPALVLLFGALLAFEFPPLFCALVLATFGLALDVQVNLFTTGGQASLGSALIKVLPFGLLGILLLRYGLSKVVNWPFLAFTVVAAISLAVLPMGRVSTNSEMLRSFIGSTAPFVLGFVLAPKEVWNTLTRGAVLVPVISALAGLITWVLGIYPAMDRIGRFQGLHSAPFLAGFCTTAIFAATLEYLRGFRTRWLLLGGLNLAILLATQARTPSLVALLFLGLVFFFSSRQVFPLKRKVDLVMGGMVPGLLLLGPALAYALERFISDDGEFNLSGRDILWPYYTEAIALRPLFGYGLGAGKLLIDPEDPMIKLVGATAAHNEYLRLSLEAGIIGCGLIFGAIILWVWSGTQRTPAAERIVLRSALVAVLLHSISDNTLISSTGVMQFIWFSAALARGRMEVRSRALRRPDEASGWRPRQRDEEAGSGP